MWGDLPAHVRDEVAAWFGTPVVGEQSQPGGFSPGVASRLQLADGRRVFVKVVGTSRNPDAPHFHRREAQVLDYLPTSVQAPRLLNFYDDGDWVALVIEDVEGRPPRLPWQAEELARVMAALERMAEDLTPAPPAATRAFADVIARKLSGWREFRDCEHLVPDPWAREHLESLIALEARAPAAARGSTLLHADLRDDNLLITADGEVVVVDWPHAAVGAAWCDFLLFLPSAAAFGGVAPGSAWAQFGPARAAAPDDVNAVLAAVTGFFLHQASLPAPQNLPTLRAFQRAQGHAALGWLRERVDGRGQDGFDRCFDR
ncbi:hypothetical protein Kisp01_42410 [Kineosporia sp. NBRC 101677]|nr:phosphotransferase [Kineosporia rhizophila]GLY17226.1 hypothetical protein Kisp01_42410 [Kineosporia sp. NBRC 101677]